MVIESVIWEILNLLSHCLSKYSIIFSKPPEAEQLTVTLRIGRKQDVSGGQECTFTSDLEVTMALSDPREEESSRGNSTLWFCRVGGVLTLIYIMI